MEALAFQQLGKKGKMAMERQVNILTMIFVSFLPSFLLPPSHLLSPHPFLSSFLRKCDLATYFGHPEGMSKAVSGISWQTGPSSLALILLPHQQSIGLTFRPWRSEQQVPAARVKGGNTPVRVSA